MNLLSANDFDHLKNAMLRHEEIVLERKLNGEKITARTFRVKPPWQVDMIVQIRKERGNVISIQNFADIEDARKACEQS